jgi:transcriptional regulator with XRE-family HTH domain
MGKTAERNPVAVDFGEHLRAHRKAQGLTLEKLAERAQLHWTYVGSVERGERNVSLFNIVAIAKALGIHPGELFGD